MPRDRSPALATVVMLAAIVLLLAVQNAHAAPPELTDEERAEAGGWTLVFEDDFESGSLNRDLWSVCYWNECTKPYEGQLQTYGPEGVFLSDGRLHLVARPVEGGDTYGSGMISSDGVFDFRFGYAEIEAQVSDATGVSTAFWLLPASRQWPPEIDVVEVRGAEPYLAYFSQHWPDGHGGSIRRSHSVTAPDLSDRPHLYGLLWTPTELVWYLDGVPRFRSTNQIPEQAMSLLVTLAVGGSWAGQPDPRDFPTEVLVEHVRVWQRGEDPRSTHTCRAACGP